MSAMEPVRQAPPGAASPAFRSRLITSLSGSAAVAYTLLVFVPGQQSIAAMQKTIREQESQIAQSLTLVQPIRELEEKQAATEQFIRSWRSKAPTPNRVAAVFAEVIRLARECDVEVTSLVPQAEQPLETIGLIPVALQAKGSYRSLHGMLERLETMSGLVWIEEMHLQPQDKASESLSCTIKLIIFANRGEISG
jgi:Tfp pilus assembly protein PilO